MSHSEIILFLICSVVMSFSLDILDDKQGQEGGNTGKRMSYKLIFSSFFFLAVLLTT